LLYLNEVPSQELAVFGRAVLEHVNETRFPRFPFPQQLRVSERTLVPEETGLHNGKVFRLP